MATKNWTAPTKANRIQRILAKSLFAGATLLACHFPAMATAIKFHDWTANFSGGVQHFDNVSSAGTIVGTSACPGCWGAPTGTFGVANAIDPPGPITFTTEFNANGNAPGSSVNFVFSNNYAWGTGGKLILGNIHNYFEYQLSAWDFGGNQIDVTTDWNLVAEYLHGAPGQLGYFSTSTTTCAGGFFDLFCRVFDPTADANSGQGGVLLFEGLLNVGRIQLTLNASDLAPNGQASDFILFNVGTPVPEPSTLLLLTASIAGFLVVAKRRQGMGS